MSWLIGVVVVLVVFGMALAMAEASLTRVNRVHAMALVEEERKHAPLLLRIQKDPPRYLNSIYLWVMIVQNGSAVLVAVLSQHYFDNLGVTIATVLFTLAYFILVEAMSKTWGVLHSDRVALALSPFAFVLSRLLYLPTKGLIAVANILLPGRGLRKGPFVSEEEIRAMAEAGSEEGAIEEEEKELIHSIFEFGDTVVREVMTPRPDVVALEASRSFGDFQDLIHKHGYSRLPVFRERLDEIVGIVHAKDVLRELRRPDGARNLADIARKAHFVPESRKVSELMKEMQRDRFHMAVVVDEFGSVVGLVTLEDLLEEIVGEIVDEYDREEPNFEASGNGGYRVNARLPVAELNELLDVELPDTEWDTVGGLMMALLGRLPQPGEHADLGSLRFTAEEMKGRRIRKVLVERLQPASTDAAEE